MHLWQPQCAGWTRRGIYGDNLTTHLMNHYSSRRVQTIYHPFKWVFLNAGTALPAFHHWFPHKIPPIKLMISGSPIKKSPKFVHNPGRDFSRLKGPLWSLDSNSWIISSNMIQLGTKALTGAFIIPTLLSVLYLLDNWFTTTFSLSVYSEKSSRPPVNCWYWYSPSRWYCTNWRVHLSHFTNTFLN
jgi:hypothetical protein